MAGTFETSWSLHDVCYWNWESELLLRAGLCNEHEEGRKIKIWIREEGRFIGLGSRVDTVSPKEHCDISSLCDFVGTNSITTTEFSY